MFILVLGLLIFLGVHSVRIFAPAWRNRRIAVMGNGPWRGFYSLTALIISIKRRGNDIPAPGPAKRDMMAAIAGLLVYGLFVWKLHEWLFGVTSLP
ncbi:NnrU family protein [Sinorhizobium numidicum]|uniref:NnrU family protein n=1 Tax=Sinorhizobium numidicum TaxID=680248 RepID=A0ABY8CR98_9HYPH|nr:NnrU family protein [Sinorhizobium numidicum]WEX75177.1 NnrU family protein [Sinorhizobium numidicum]WEX81170.1 NnrU family protein [Sinorhizobium numidicum]